MTPRIWDGRSLAAITPEELVCLLVRAMAVIRLRWEDSRKHAQTKHGSCVLMEKNVSPLT